jgi:hypothetical protein
MCREYIDLFKKALPRIKPSYFRLTTTYEPSGIVRERVFCYELYHQIRSIMTDDKKLSLNGEIDKRSHKDFEKGDRKNPDFVFHMPGKRHFNALVVEVKGKLLDFRGRPLNSIRKDFETIRLFINKYNYRAGVFILYNHSFEELMKRHGQTIAQLRSDPSGSSIFILSISQPLGCCEEHVLARV